MMSMSNLGGCPQKAYEARWVVWIIHCRLLPNADLGERGSKKTPKFCGLHLIMAHFASFLYPAFFLTEPCYLFFADRPEIEVDHSWIRTGDGIEAEVSCNVHAEPRAEVSSWHFPLLGWWCSDHVGCSPTKFCSISIKGLLDFHITPFITAQVSKSCALFWNRVVTRSNIGPLVFNLDTSSM